MTLVVAPYSHELAPLTHGTIRNDGGPRTPIPEGGDHRVSSVPMVQITNVPIATMRIRPVAFHRTAE